MNTLTLDKSDPEIAEAVKDCKVGKPITFSRIIGVTTEDTPESITFEVSEVEVDYSAADETEEEVPEKESYSKMPKAVIMIGMPGKKAA